MNPHAVLSPVVAVINKLPVIIQQALDLRVEAAKNCPLAGQEIKLSLLLGRCWFCGAEQFFLLQTEQYTAVQCSGCHWTAELPEDRWWGRLGRYLFRCATPLPLGTVRRSSILVRGYP